MGALAVGLTLLTFFQTTVWSSEQALWTAARAVTPEAPRPWINLAVVAIRAGQLDEASDLLDQATCRARYGDRSDQRWAHEQIAATQAVIALRRGDWPEVQRLIGGMPRFSAPGDLCRANPAVCTGS